MIQLIFRKAIKTYSELSRLSTFEERYNYLRLLGRVGEDTFGFDRYMNQMFYRSKEWKQIRDYVIARDLGCDMGLEGYEINGPVYVHHMNPITPNDIENSTEQLLNPEYLVCVSKDTHDAIHYGLEKNYNKYKIIERAPNDTCPWKI